MTPAHTRVVQPDGRHVTTELEKVIRSTTERSGKLKALVILRQSCLPLTNEVHNEIRTELAVLQMRSPQARTRMARARGGERGAGREKPTFFSQTYRLTRQSLFEI